MNYKFHPYSKNIIFFDTEFSSLDPNKGELLSIGLVTVDAREFYLELKYDGPADPWVRENIIPTLNGPKIEKDNALNEIRNFVGKDKPYLVSYVNQYDTLCLYKLFGRKDEPYFWLPIDFASILFGMGVDPEAYYPTDKKNFFKEIGIDASKYKMHNALDDAKLLREVYLKMTDPETSSG